MQNVENAKKGHFYAMEKFSDLMKTLRSYDNFCPSLY